jgi:hypothetical protein
MATRPGETEQVLDRLPVTGSDARFHDVPVGRVAVELQSAGRVLGRAEMYLRTVEAGIVIGRAGRT